MLAIHLLLSRILLRCIQRLCETLTQMSSAQHALSMPKTSVLSTAVGPLLLHLLHTHQWSHRFSSQAVEEGSLGLSPFLYISVLKKSQRVSHRKGQFLIVGQGQNLYSVTSKTLLIVCAYVTFCPQNNEFCVLHSSFQEGCVEISTKLLHQSHLAYNKHQPCDFLTIIIACRHHRYSYVYLM